MGQKKRFGTILLFVPLLACGCAHTMFRITSNPPGADVQIDEEHGKTPITIIRNYWLPAPLCFHTKVSKEGYEPQYLPLPRGGGHYHFELKYTYPYTSLLAEQVYRHDFERDPNSKLESDIDIDENKNLTFGVGDILFRIHRQRLGNEVASVWPKRAIRRFPTTPRWTGTHAYNGPDGNDLTIYTHRDYYRGTVGVILDSNDCMATDRPFIRVLVPGIPYVDKAVGGDRWGEPNSVPFFTRRPIQLENWSLRYGGKSGGNYQFQVIARDEGDQTKEIEIVQEVLITPQEFAHGFVIKGVQVTGVTESALGLITITVIDLRADVTAALEDGATPLFVASLMGNLEVVRLLCATKADVNASDKTNGASPLCMASQNGHLEIVKRLLEAKADVNAARNDGVTPLFMASQKGHLEIIKLLLEAKADVNAAHKTDGTSPLILAAGHGNSEAVRLLLEANADVFAASAKHGSALWQASQIGNSDIVRMLLVAKADVNATHSSGATPLSIASQNGYSDVVKLLLGANADVSIARKTDSATPLCMASQNGHLEIVRMLLEAKADVNAAHKDGYTSLWMASKNGHLEIVKLLLEAKADVDAAPTDGSSPLWQASQNDHREIVKLLLEAKADVNVALTCGDTPLSKASENGHSEIIKLLVEAKADVNAGCRTRGIAPLFMASQNGHLEVVRVLLEAKADVNTKSPNGTTALLIALRMGHAETARLLILGGADVTVESMGQTSLDLARNKNYTEVTELLIRVLQSQLDTWVLEGMPISPDELHVYYEQVKIERFVKNPKVQFRLIDVKPASLRLSEVNSAASETHAGAALRIATELCERVAKGEEFGELARTYSHGLRQSQAGLWPPVSPSALVSPYNVLGKLAWDMEVGQVSKPIQLPGHVFILKLEQKEQENNRSYDEVKEPLEEEFRILKRKKLEEMLLRS